MKFKDLLERIEGGTEVCADLVMYTKSSSGFRHKVFTALASDFFTEKIWLDKEVAKIYPERIEQFDDYACRINVVLREERE